MNNTKRQTPLPSEIPSLEYAQIFTASSIMFDTGKGNELATFDVTVREMPGKKNFLLLGGIEELINTILNWKYDSHFVDYLLKEKLISENFAKHLKKFTFKGDVWAMPEGTVFFPGEPVARITTSLCDANLFTAFLVNVICYPTLFLSKAVRVRFAAKGKPVYFASAMRAFSFENVLKIQRYSYLLGAAVHVPYASYHFGIKGRKPAIGFYHALIKSFRSEEEAYRHFLPWTEGFSISTSMVDTYNIKTGINNWIKVEKEARQKGQSLGAVSIDSGDVFETAEFFRKKLDAAGLTNTLILAYSNLDEFKIAKLEKRGAKISGYCAFTEVITVSDRPVLEVVYKLAERIDENGKINYAAKLTPGKTSLPGRKQVFRKYHKNGQIKEDIVGLENEKLGKPLLIEYIKKGKLALPLPSLEAIKENLESELSKLPEEFKDVNKTVNYKVKVSKTVSNILSSLKRKHA
jgi:nicotinate phosphoribosyltransferase